MKITMDQYNIVLSDGELVCKFEGKSGQLQSVSNSRMSLASSGLLVDVGCNGEFKMGTLGFHSLDRANTWELPPIVPEMSNIREWEFKGFEQCDGGLVMIYCIDGLEIHVCYRIYHENLKVSAWIRNLKEERILINGAAFILTDNREHDDTVYDFPGNVPHNEFTLSDMEEYKAVQTGLVNPVIHTLSQGSHMNLIFIDDQEKWGTGVYKDRKGRLIYVNLAAVECFISPRQSIYFGDLYIQLIGGKDPFEPVRKLYNRYGWCPPADGISDGVLYSCHPHGTMDSNFPLKRTMVEFAEELEKLKAMGIDHIWLLPIFDHGERGVYHPTDQSIIDEKYGGDEAVRYFCEKAHELGMTVLFDYVPHGPAPEDRLAREHTDWCAVDRNGNLQIEWNCVSFDMANTEYQGYTNELIKNHIDRFDIDGSRIDCAMGGLSNWKPCAGNRPSSSNLKGGVAISRAVRDAFIQKGKQPFITPENFNPVPLYCPYTDAFYDMAFYRVLVELENARLTPEEYTCRMTRWLRSELLSTPKGYNKLRFLGNHDTVTWVWQKARAPRVYGIDKAKALWALITFTDGIPMIYQGDEDPAIYMGTGPELREFFSEIFKARKQWLGHGYDTEYIFTGTPVLAFARSLSKKKRLVLINFSPKKEGCVIKLGTGKPVFGRCGVEGNKFSLDSYAFDIIDIKNS